MAVHVLSRVCLPPTATDSYVEQVHDLFKSRTARRSSNSYRSNSHISVLRHNTYASARPGEQLLPAICTMNSFICVNDELLLPPLSVKCTCE